MLRVEADGGSRGNPGVAGFGALVRDGASGRILAECAGPLGRESNNVAEYTGLVEGLRAAYRVDPSARIEVTMDSKLVVEQMSGRWKIKHEDMRRLAQQARDAADRFDGGAASVTYRWVPRHRNKDADRLSNVGMDGETVDLLYGDSGTFDDLSASDESGTQGSRAASGAGGTSGAGAATAALPAAVDEADGATDDETGLVPPPSPLPRRTDPGHQPDLGPPVRLVLVRHGVTDHTVAGRLGGRGGLDPDLNPEGQRQAQALAAGIRAFVGVEPGPRVRVVTSALARARQTGAVVGAALGVRVELDEDWDEQGSGAWDGLTAAEMLRADADGLQALRSDPNFVPPGGESYAELNRRVLAARDRLLATAEPGQTVVVVTHRRPILAVLGDVLGATFEHVARFTIAPTSLTSLACWADGGIAIQFVNDTSHLR